MRGLGRAFGFLAGAALFAAACTFGAGSTSPTAQVSPQSSPSSTTGNPAQSTPVASPSVQPTTSASGLTIASTPVHNGEVGVIYLAVTFQAAGGTAPYTWAVLDGTVPPGLALSAGGTFTGNDTAAGNFSFDVKVTDSGGQTATGKVSLRVFPALAVSQPCVNACLVGYGCTTCGRFGTVTGGAGPYNYKVVGGAVPTGMSLNGFALGGAWPAPLFVPGNVDVIAVGPPRALWNLSVSVTDDFGVSKTVNANWLEFGPISMNCTVGVQCTSCGSNGCVDTSITYSGGNPTDNVTVLVTGACFQGPTGANQCSPGASQVAAYLPPIWSASAKNGVVTVTAGCDTSCQSWVGDVTIVLVDHGACVAPAYVQSPSTIFDIDF